MEHAPRLTPKTPLLGNVALAGARLMDEVQKLAATEQPKTWLKDLKTFWREDFGTFFRGLIHCTQVFEGVTFHYLVMSF